MIIFITIVIILNVIGYIWVYLEWRKDCKEIGKEDLAVSLKERMRALFLCLTLPCILGFLVRK